LNLPKRSTVAIDVGVQTDSVMVGINGQKPIYDDLGTDITEEDAVTSLPASALASVLKWSKDIAADIHLFSGISVIHDQAVPEFTHQSLALQRLTEIATGQLLEDFHCAELTYYRQSYLGPRVPALSSQGQAESIKWLRA
jgi:hypothetical protein